MSEINDIGALTAEFFPSESIIGSLSVVDFHLQPLEDGEGCSIVDSDGNTINAFTPEHQVEALHGEIFIQDEIRPTACLLITAPILINS